MKPAGLGLAALALALSGCRATPPDPVAAESRSPNAQPEIVASLREDLAAKRHPSDGGGRAWLEGDVVARAGSSGRWVLVYEAGPHGIAPGGMLLLQVSPFWGWGTPQVDAPEAPGYTTVSTEAEGVALEPATLGPQLLGVHLAGRTLREGERVRLVFGDGPRGARADTYAERGSRFWIAVDGDGDGVRGLLSDSPTVDVAPGPPARLAVTLPSVVRPGESVRLNVAVLDAVGNAWPEVEGTVELTVTGEGLRLPAEVPLPGSARGRLAVEGWTTGEGTVRVDVAGPGGFSGSSNPLVVSATLPRVYWGDLHGHSGLSDGTGTPEDFYLYARDIAALDVAALTDHDHWGMQALSQNPALWDGIREQVMAFHEPGRFVTLLGYEWTSWIHGHRHVLYFEDEGRVLSSVDPDFESPVQLWEALRGEPAMTIAHHTAGGPIATNWDIPPDPELEPVTEVSSVHGSSEAPDSPRVIYQPVAGHFARDALDRGYRLGFVGSGDGHDGHPGLSHLASPNGGLVAILAEELTREAVLEALRARRVYATNGPRILLLATLDGTPMGAAVAPTDEASLGVLVVAPGALERLDLVRSGAVVKSVAAEGYREMGLDETVRDLESGEYLYVRAVQRDGGAAWSSPFFVE